MALNYIILFLIWDENFKKRLQEDALIPKEEEEKVDNQVY